jgi:hypothetical protein
MNAHDPVTSERGGLSPYRAVEPWLLLYIIIRVKLSPALDKTALIMRHIQSVHLIVKIILPIRISMRRPAALRCNGMKSEKF